MIQKYKKEDPKKYLPLASGAVIPFKREER